MSTAMDLGPDPGASCLREGPRPRNRQEGSASYWRNLTPKMGRRDASNASTVCPGAKDGAVTPMPGSVSPLRQD